MGGLYHDFFVLSVNQYPYRGFGKLYNSPDALRIHDDHLRYLYDSLLWIPSFNPLIIKLTAQSGLNLYGETIIKKDGALVARRILRAWSELFHCGPEIIELTGSYAFDPEIPDEGCYEKLTINRDEFVEQLETLAKYCDRVIESNDGEFILHIGI